MSSRGMNNPSIGDFINNYGKTESSSDDDESSGGWSDTDTATITSNVTDITYGTLGSAIVVDATEQTTSKEAAKKIRKGRRPVHRGQLHEDIVPGLRPLEKSETVLTSPKLKSPKPKTQKKRSSVDQSSAEEILFIPSGPLDQFPTTGTTKNTTTTTTTTNQQVDSGEKKKKKKSKNSKSSKSLSEIENMLQQSDPPKKEKKKEKKKDKGKDKDKDKDKDKKKKKKKKIVTLEEDPARENGVVAKRSKKKKKKKSKKDNCSTHSSPARLVIAHAA